MEEDDCEMPLEALENHDVIWKSWRHQDRVMRHPITLYVFSVSLNQLQDPFSKTLPAVQEVLIMTVAMIWEQSPTTGEVCGW